MSNILKLPALDPATISPVTGSRYEDYSYQITFSSRDGRISASAWLNTLGIKSLVWSIPRKGLAEGMKATTPFAFSRGGTTTLATRDGVNLFEGGFGYRFGFSWRRLAAR